MIKKIVVCIGLLVAVPAVRAAYTDAELFTLWETNFKSDPATWGSPTAFDCLDRAWKSMIYAFACMYAYGYTGDVSWLEIAGNGLDLMKQGLRTNPRGEPAFITASSQFFNAGNGLTGVDVGGESFKMIQGYAMFAAFVLNEPAASAALVEKANRHLSFVKDTLWVRWNRDWWYQSDDYALIHPNAGVYRYPTYPELDPNPAVKCHTSQYNKQHDAGRVNLYLWKATGDSTYWHLARRQIVNYLSKCRLKGADGSYYEWDYGNPAGPYDSGCEDKSWIEHSGGYMRLTTDFVIECYEAGIAVDSKEVNRFITTMLTKIWNGDLEDPDFALNDGSNMGDGGSLSGFAGLNDTIDIVTRNAITNYWEAEQKVFHIQEGPVHLLYFKKIMEEGNFLPDDEIRDYIPPKHVGCTAPNKGQVRITFDESMDPASCLNTANWTLSRDLPVVGVTVSEDSRVVTLYTEEQQEGVNYKVTVGAADAAGNAYFNHLFHAVRFDAGTLPLNHGGLGVADTRSTGRIVPPAVTVFPNPVRGTATITANGLVEIFDANGRLRRTYPRGCQWDGCGSDGRPVPEGTYMVRSGGTVQRIMVVD